MPLLQRMQRQQKGASPFRSSLSCLGTTPRGAERLDRRSEDIHEALAEEIQIGEQRKERRTRVTTAAQAPNLAARTSHELRENPICHCPIPKQRLLMESASSAAGCSGQQCVERSATDAVPEALIGVPMELGTDESSHQQTPDEELL